MNADGTAPPVPAAPRGKGATKIFVAVAIAAGAVGVLLYSSTLSGMEYYKHVDEVMANADAFRGKKLQVHGNVVTGSIEQVKGTLQYRFKIETKAPRTAAVITATYTGLVPDTFKNGAEVVAKGMLAPDNHLQVSPDGIMAKCPSKYDEKKGALPTTAATLPVKSAL